MNSTTSKSYNYSNVVGGQYGWVCPICKRVLSPWTQECPYEGPSQQTWTTTTTGETQKVNVINKELSELSDKDLDRINKLKEELGLSTLETYYYLKTRGDINE